MLRVVYGGSLKSEKLKVFDRTGTDGSSKCQITTSSGTGKNSFFS